jgi:3-oxoacyl-[acyl-carrier protein] reductase
MDLGLRGKLALVTGGSRGIGLRIARCLADEGVNVAICGRTRETLDSAVNDLRARGVTASAIVADVAAPGESERFVEEGAQALGGLDILVANAGGSSGGAFPDATIEDWKSTFDLNLFHAVRCIRIAVPHMRARGGGSVVTISSISGWRPGADPQYATTKAAEIFLAQSLAWQLGKDRIRVNTISPGSTLFEGGGWDAWSKSDPDKFKRFEQADFPWGRLGTPEEVADAAVFLLSPRAMWINGANIPVDGGQAWGSVFAGM